MANVKLKDDVEFGNTVVTPILEIVGQQQEQMPVPVEAVKAGKIPQIGSQVASTPAVAENSDSAHLKAHGQQVAPWLNIARGQHGRKVVVATSILGIALGIFGTFIAARMWRGQDEAVKPQMVQVSLKDSGVFQETAGSLVIYPLADSSAAESAPEVGDNDSVTTGPGETLFLTGTQRVFAPEFGQASAADAMAAGGLQPANSFYGRYTTPITPVEWQGEWSFSRPDRNIRIGTQYMEYLEGRFGKGSATNLISFERSPSQVLAKVEPGRQSGLQELKAYSR